MATLEQLITRVTQRLSMVAGTGVQIYAEDRIAEMIQHKFDVLFDEEFWPQFSSWQTLTLDGSTGIVTTDLTDTLKRFDDIQVIFPENSHTPIARLSGLTTNPFELSGTEPLFYDANPGSTSRPFLIWPKTATGDVIVNLRNKQDSFVAGDTIDFDDQANILGSTYDYLEDDGTNSNATQKFQQLFEQRVNQLKKNLSHAPIALDRNEVFPSGFAFVPLTL